MTHTPGTLSEQWLTTKNQRLREINRELLAALMSIVANGILLADGAKPGDIRLLDKAEAAIRKATP